MVVLVQVKHSTIVVYRQMKILSSPVLKYGHSLIRFRNLSITTTKTEKNLKMSSFSYFHLTNAKKETRCNEQITTNRTIFVCLSFPLFQLVQTFKCIYQIDSFLSLMFYLIKTLCTHPVKINEFRQNVFSLFLQKINKRKDLRNNSSHVVFLF